MIYYFSSQFGKIKMLSNLLVALDFDHTVIDGNSDIKVKELVPDQSIPDEVKKLYKENGWTAYMRGIFKFLHSQGIDESQILDAVSGIPFVPDMKDLLQILHSKNAELIIISDSNSVFIEHSLKSANLDHTVSNIFTNPAKFNTEGCLEIEMYHLQDWCTLSTKNLCKGHILETYIKDRKKEGKTFHSVAYVGDGKNDLCPCLRLSKDDVAFPRVGYALIDYIPRIERKKGKIVKAKVCPWSTANEIVKNILQHYNSVH